MNTRFQITFNFLILFLTLNSCSNNSNSKTYKPSNHCNDLNNKGVDYMMKFAPDEPHDIDTAISLLKQAIDCDPQFLAAYVNLANAYDKSNDYDKELAVINKELALSKSDPSILLNKARLFEKSNKVDSAKNIYGLTQIILDEKLKKQPNNIGLIQSKILLLALTVGKDEAMKELNHQINICPEYKKELQSEYLYFKNFDRHSYIYGYSVVQSF